MRRLRFGLAQINTTVGDLQGNAAKVADYVRRARDLGVDIVSFPELTVTGYPPEDLLLRPAFIRDNLAALESLVPECTGITAVVGFVDLHESDIYNAAAVIHDGRLASVYHKHYLPNYGVFDEFRYFRPGDEAPVYTVAGVGVGVNICEDIWYAGDPTRRQAYSGAQVIVNINGSPYHMGKRRFREQMLAGRARDYGVCVCYTNQVGGQDELVFDGGSMVLDASGELVARAAMFEEELLVCDLDVEEVLRAHLRDPRHRQERATYAAGEGNVTLSEQPFVSARPAIERRLAPEPEGEAEVYAALVTGTRDYLQKTGFAKAVIALSGGIDSSLVAAIAVDAIGAGNVTGVSMPSRYSSEGSISDAKELAENLGVRFLIIPIEPAHAVYLDMLSEPFAGTEPGTAEENVQSRIRGNIIMALSNKFGWIVLTTGNKSEFATGYATLAGDLVGGFGVIRDVPKTLVYKLSHYRNTLGERPAIPPSVLTKPPSAELKPGQLDQDTLPPYDILDAILLEYVEHDRSPQDIIVMGFDEATVKRVVQMVRRNEYKRRQAPPGVKITPRAFGRDWRLPIANKYVGF
ncbi:MAG: NAD+ synthase [Dehalococcoidia bacterium]|nr:NAD+ synthase [Dehalococcoidia bacterium]